MNASLLFAPVCLLLASFTPRAERVSTWTGEVDEPVAAVWHAFTTADGLRGWRGVHAEVDLRVGGTLRLGLEPDAKLDAAETVVETILAYEPERMLATREATPSEPSDLSGAPAADDVWRVTYFNPLTPTRTQLRIVVVASGQGAASDDEQAFFSDLCAVQRDALERSLREHPEKRKVQATSKLRTAVSERVVDATPAEVWKLYTTREGCESWMVARASIELALGGVIKTSYDPKSTLADGSTIVTHVLAYEPERLLVTRFEVPESARSLELAEATWVVQTFEPVGTDKTRVRCAHLGFGEGDEWDRVYAFFEHGNAEEHGSLAKRCAELRAAK